LDSLPLSASFTITKPNDEQRLPANKNGPEGPLLKTAN